VPDPLVDYAELADTAKELVEGFGREVSFVKLNRTPADANIPWDGPADPRVGATTEPGSAVFVEPSSATELGISTTLLETLAKRSGAIMIAALGSTSTVDLMGYDEVVDGTVRWKIVGVEKLQPASTTLLYFVGVAGK